MRRKLTIACMAVVGLLIGGFLYYKERDHATSGGRNSLNPEKATGIQQGGEAATTSPTTTELNLKQSAAKLEMLISALDKLKIENPSSSVQEKVDYAVKYSLNEVDRQTFWKGITYLENCDEFPEDLRASVILNAITRRGNRLTDEDLGLVVQNALLSKSNKLVAFAIISELKEFPLKRLMPIVDRITDENLREEIHFLPAIIQAKAEADLPGTVADLAARSEKLELQAYYQMGNAAAGFRKLDQAKVMNQLTNSASPNREKIMSLTVRVWSLWLEKDTNQSLLWLDQNKQNLTPEDFDTLVRSALPVIAPWDKAAAAAWAARIHDSELRAQIENALKK